MIFRFHPRFRDAALGSKVMKDDPAFIQLVEQHDTRLENYLNSQPLVQAEITSPQTGQHIIYDGTTWVNAEPALDENSDVVITSPATAEVLRYNGTDWVNYSGPNSFAPTVKFGATTATVASDSVYFQFGQMIVTNIAFRVTNLNGGTGTLTITLPFSRRSITNPANSYTNALGSAGLIDVSAAQIYHSFPTPNTDADIVLRSPAWPATVVTHNSPVTVAAGGSGTGDEFYATITYEVA